VVHWSDRPQEVYEPGWLNLTHRNYLVRWVEWGALCDDHVLLYASKIANKQKPGWIHHLCVILFIVLNDADDLIEAPESREVKVGFIERCREWPKGPSYHRDVSVEIDRSSAICSTCSQCNHSGKSTSWGWMPGGSGESSDLLMLENWETSSCLGRAYREKISSWNELKRILTAAKKKINKRNNIS